MSILIAVLVQSVYLLLPSKISYVFVGKSKSQRTQSRIGFILMLAVFLNIGVYGVLYSPYVLMIGCINWILMAMCVVKPDLKKQ
jgi:hypothetical protein